MPFMNAQGNTIRILIADDHELMRTGLCTLLKDHPGWGVCGAAINGADAIEQAARLKPDLMLVDLSMPDLSGFEVANRVHQELPECKILIMSELDARDLAYAQGQPGVLGYIIKSRLGRDLVPAIEAAIQSSHLSASASA
jgi:two-component system response regulator NreC